jgi:hypothetical protein
VKSKGIKASNDHDSVSILSVVSTVQVSKRKERRVTRDKGSTTTVRGISYAVLSRRHILYGYIIILRGPALAHKTIKYRHGDQRNQKGATVGAPIPLWPFLFAGIRSNA